MQQRQIRGLFGPIWATEFPEIVGELVYLFEDAGTITWAYVNKETNPSFVKIILTLHFPVKVGVYGSLVSMSVNPNTLEPITGNLSMKFDSLPKARDTEVSFKIYLAFRSIRPDDQKTIDDMRKELRRLAKNMTGIWDFI